MGTALWVYEILYMVKKVKDLIIGRYMARKEIVRTGVILLCIIHNRNCHNLNSKLNTTSTTTELDDPQLHFDS